MKKLLTIILAVAMVIAITACGNQTPTSTDITSATEKTTEKESKKETKKMTEATIEETVLLDEAGVKITAKELKYSSYSVSLAISIENNTDQMLSFYSGTMGYSVNSINGYMVSGGYIGEDVAAGMTSNETMNFDLTDLAFYGITGIADITVGFQIKTEDYNEYLITGPIEIKTSLASGYDYSKDTFAETMQNSAFLKDYGFSQIYFDTTDLIGESGCKDYCQIVLTNDDGDMMLLMEAGNSSSDDISLSFNNISLNGVSACSGTWTSDSVSAGKRVVADLILTEILDSKTAKALGITDLNEVAFDLTAYDSDYDVIWEKHINIPFNGSASNVDDSGDIVYDANSIKFIYKGVSEDESKYSDDLHILFLVKNDSGQAIDVNTDFLGGTYINKTKVSSISYGVNVQPGQSGVLDIELMDYDLEDNGITLENITDISIDMAIRDMDYNEIDMTTITKTLG